GASFAGSPFPGAAFTRAGRLWNGAQAGLCRAVSQRCCWGAGRWCRNFVGNPGWWGSNPFFFVPAYYGPTYLDPLWYPGFGYDGYYVYDGGRRRDRNRAEALEEPVQEPSEGIGNVELRLEPKDVLVYVNDSLVARSGRTSFNLAAGEWTLRFARS